MTGQQKKLSEAKDFSDRLSRAMVLRGVNGSAVAEGTGVDRGYISLLRSGKRKNPSQEMLAGLARFLNVRVDWLLSGEGPMDLPTDAELDARVDAQFASGSARAASAMTDQDLIEYVDEWWASLKADTNPRKRAARAETILAFLTELHRRDISKK